MKLNEDKAGVKSIESEGKLLEIIPLIFSPVGEPLTLPPVVYRVPNWLLGFREDHYVGKPIAMYFGERANIPGSNASYSHQLTFFVRILEASPSSGIEIATVDEKAVVGLIQALREQGK